MGEAFIAHRISALQGTAYARNLLDNSDFTNPVNQRGSTSYTGAKYGIDRWYGRAQNQTVSVESTNVKVTATSTSYAGIKQKVENIAQYAGKTVTLACRLYSTKGVAIGFVDASDTALNETVDNTSGDRIVICTYEIPSGATVDTVIPRLLLRTTASGDYMRLYWVALYEGEYTLETLPPYMPKGYGAELAECLRYFERQNAVDVHAIGTSYYAGSATILRTTIMYHPKRIVPTVTLNFSSSGAIVNGAYVTISKTTSFDSSKTMSVITFETSAGTTAMPAAVYAIGYIDISADL